MNVSMATFYQKTKLLKGLLTGEIAYTGPFHVTVDITSRCNLHCVGCRFHSFEVRRPSPGDQSVPDISFDMLKDLCDEIRKMNSRTLFLMGEGEPFLHDRIFEIIAMAKRAGFHVMIITNGTLLNQEKIKSLLNSRLDVLQVSLWGSSPQEYEQQYAGSDPNNFEKVVDGLKLLKFLKAERKSKHPIVTLHNPINRHNVKKIDAMVDLALVTGCDAISFSPFLSTKGRLSSYSLSQDEERTLYLSLAKMKKRLRSLPLSHNIDRTLLRYRTGRKVGNKWRLPCYMGWAHVRVRVDGTVVPCGPCNIPMGNLKENNFHEIWNGSPYRIFRRQASTRESLATLGEQCDCEFCCYTEDNLQVHRLFRWLSPFVHKPQR